MGAGFGICQGFLGMLLVVLGSGRALTGLFLNCVPEWGRTRLADWEIDVSRMEDLPFLETMRPYG